MKRYHSQEQTYWNRIHCNLSVHINLTIEDDVEMNPTKGCPRTLSTTVTIYIYTQTFKYNRLLPEYQMFE